MYHHHRAGRFTFDVDDELNLIISTGDTRLVIPQSSQHVFCEGVEFAAKVARDLSWSVEPKTGGEIPAPAEPEPLAPTPQAV